MVRVKHITHVDMKGGNIAFHCPTCGKCVYIQGQLTIHRETTGSCIGRYLRGHEGVGNMRQ